MTDDARRELIRVLNGEPLSASLIDLLLLSVATFEATRARLHLIAETARTIEPKSISTALLVETAQALGEIEKILAQISEHES